METPGKKVFIYGSLRRGHYNHDRFDFGSKTVFHGSEVLNGARLYDLGVYPCMVLTDRSEDKVVGEVYEFTDTKLERLIHNMEIGAGYVEVEVTVELGMVKTYVFETAPAEGVLVDSGDWNDRVD